MDPLYHFIFWSVVGRNCNSNWLLDSTSKPSVPIPFRATCLLHRNLFFKRIVSAYFLYNNRVGFNQLNFFPYGTLWPSTTHRPSVANQQWIATSSFVLHLNNLNLFESKAASPSNQTKVCEVQVNNNVIQVFQPCSYAKMQISQFITYFAIVFNFYGPRIPPFQQWKLGWACCFFARRLRRVASILYAKAMPRVGNEPGNWKNWHEQKFDFFVFDLFFSLPFFYACAPPLAGALAVTMGV